MSTSTKIEDPDEMSRNAAFHQGLHCLLKQKQSSEKDIQFYLEIITCDPSMYSMDHPKLIVLNQKEESDWFQPNLNAKNSLGMAYIIKKQNKKSNDSLKAYAENQSAYFAD